MDSTSSQKGRTFYKYALKLNVLEPDFKPWIIILKTLELHHDQELPTSFHKPPIQMRFAIVLASLLATGVMSIPLFKRQDVVDDHVIDDLQNFNDCMNLSSNIRSWR